MNNNCNSAALRAGLVSRVVKDDQVKFEALKIAESIGKHSKSVTALGKAFFYAQIELKQADAYRFFFLKVHLLLKISTLVHMNNALFDYSLSMKRILFNLKRNDNRILPKNLFLMIDF